MAMQLTGGADLLDVVGGGFISRNVENVMSRASEAVRSLMPKHGMDFINKWRDSYKTIGMNEAMNLRGRLQQQRDHAWDTLSVRRLGSIEEIQRAGPVMQRWVMAYPTVRERYLTNSLSGYADSYTNVYGDVIGVDHVDYRRVMTGVGSLQDGHYDKHRYGDLLTDGEQELRGSQQMAILKTWDLLGQYFDEENADEELEDPTCPYGTLM